MTITADDTEELEEERRLCYVGITRAEEKLTLTCARRRMIRGETQFNKMSRFIREIPFEILDTGAFKMEKDEEIPVQNTYRNAREAFRAKPFAAGYAREQKQQTGNSPFLPCRRGASSPRRHQKDSPTAQATGCGM